MDRAQSEEILDELKKTYPTANCELEYGSEFELLVSVILSAQCTDKRVNKVTEELFKVANTPQQFADMPQEVLEKYIFSCGFYRNKAKSIIAASRDIVNKFGGKVPDTFEKLTELSGVGRKTANVMIAEAFKGQAIAVDTHVFRVSNRIGLAHADTPEQCEMQLRELLNPSRYTESHHLLIFHGRYCCHSMKPACNECPIARECEFYKKTV